jgi:hypothetical protein
MYLPYYRKGFDLTSVEAGGMRLPVLCTALSE